MRTVINSCCFTGHRQIPLAELAPLTQHLDDVLSALYRDGCRDFYAGGALGFDTLAASRVLLLRREHPDARLHLLLPCRDQAKDWPPPEAARFEEILSRADTFRYVREEYAASAMADRNRELVEEGDICVAYVRRRGSGSGQTARLAHDKGITVINLADRFLSAL